MSSPRRFLQLLGFPTSHHPHSRHHNHYHHVSSNSSSNSFSSTSLTVVGFWALILLSLLIFVALVSLLGIGGSVSLDNRNAPAARAACGGKHYGTGIESPFHDKRSDLYDKLESEFEEKGPQFLIGGTTSQSLKVSDLFRIEEGGVVKPILKAAKPPVRANVLFLEPSIAKTMGAIVKSNLESHFKGGVWLQDPSFYHMSMFHASHHLEPIMTSEKQLEEEIRSVKSLSKKVCPLQVSLDRIVLTSSGVLLACWQVLSGTDPAEIRAALKEALPRAPKKQLYDRVILHTSLARLLSPPVWPDGTVAGSVDASMPILRSIVSELNRQLCRTKASVRELWFVEELDRLALALNGRIKPRRFNLTCIHPDWSASVD